MKMNYTFVINPNPYRWPMTYHVLEMFALETDTTWHKQPAKWHAHEWHVWKLGQILALLMYPNPPDPEGLKRSYTYQRRL
jgi:hypothetical protein